MGVWEMNTVEFITANDLQRWIDHLTDKEKELLICVSERVFPEIDEMLFPHHIGHYLSAKGFNGFVMVATKDYVSIRDKGDE